jgi:hypothetical protein
MSSYCRRFATKEVKKARKLARMQAQMEAFRAELLEKANKSENESNIVIGADGKARTKNEAEMLMNLK